MRRPSSMFVVVPVVSLLLAACAGSGAPADSAEDTLSLTSIQPANATAGVDVSTPVVLRFNHAMMSSMEMLVMLHEGSIAGAEVPVTAAWSADYTTLTLVPRSPLKRATTYVVHLAPSLKDTAGHMINMAHSAMMGGQMVSAGMMGGGAMMGGQMVSAGMMGTGWQAADGTFGMIFAFTTA